jgi:hypothetical protein
MGLKLSIKNPIPYFSLAIAGTISALQLTTGICLTVLSAGIGSHIGILLKFFNSLCSIFLKGIDFIVNTFVDVVGIGL